MKIGFIGLGRMGFGMVQLLTDKGHDVVAYDINEKAVQEIANYGAQGVNTVDQMLSALDGEDHKFVWIMVQRGIVQTVLDDLQPRLAEGDIIVDGGNTFYKETIERSKLANSSGISYMDVGVSGGVTAARNGACLMIGGNKELFDRYEPIFRDLAQKDGYGYMGESGAGHLVKGLHNGIEYGMMQAIGDGFEAIMDQKDSFNLQPTEILKVYNHGSIIESALTRWLEKAWHEDDELSQIAGSVPTGDTADEMKELSRLSTNPSLSMSIEEREKSQSTPRFAAKAVAAMRNQFGGHKLILNSEQGNKDDEQ